MDLNFEGWFQVLREFDPAPALELGFTDVLPVLVAEPLWVMDLVVVWIPPFLSKAH